MKLQDIMKDRNLSKLQLALGSGVNPSDLYCAMAGKKPFYPKWRKQIADYLQVAEEEIFKGGEVL